MRSGITPAEASRIILDHTPVLEPETVGVNEALGRVLAEPIRAQRDLPPADNSAMDGYAVRAADLAGASAGRPVDLPIVFSIHAGGPADRRLEPGQAARILTGAAVPPGADTVVRQEDTEREGERVVFRSAPPPGDHVRRAGEDVRAGTEILEPGSILGPAHVGMLTSLGRGFVAVHRRPRVALLSSGDELVEPDGDLSGGNIVSSNSYSLAAQCREEGALPQYLGIARDTPEDIERHLRGGLAADVLISSAGVSVGDRDFMRSVLEKIGCRLLFWGVNMKPGYPLAFGAFGDDAAPARGPLVFGLPGNPVSAMVTFEQFARPALRRMLGHQRLHRRTATVRLGETLAKKPGRLHFVRVTLSREGEEIIAHSTGNQSSGVLRSMTRAHALLIFPADASELREGEPATVQVLDEGFFASDAPGF